MAEGQRPHRYDREGRSREEMNNTYLPSDKPVEGRFRAGVNRRNDSRTCPTETGTDTRRTRGPNDQRRRSSHPVNNERREGSERRAPNPPEDRKPRTTQHERGGTSGRRRFDESGERRQFANRERGGHRVDNAPEIPDDIQPADLDADIRRDLKSLDKTNAETVARHLLVASNLLDENPTLALAHARAARNRAGRIAVVREAAGVAAYQCGEWSEALSELRAARRMSGEQSLIPLIADCERGLGRPEKAIEYAHSDEAAQLTGEDRTELLIVEAGAHLDLHNAHEALATLERADLSVGQEGISPTRLFYTYAEALLAAGKTDEAITWFLNASAADIDDATDAELRVAELSEKPE